MWTKSLFELFTLGNHTFYSDPLTKTNKPRERPVGDTIREDDWNWQKDENRLRKIRDEPNAWQTRKFFLGTTVHTPEHKIVNVMRRRTCWTTQEIKDRAKLKLGTTLQILKKLEKHGIVKSNRPTEGKSSYMGA